MNNGYNNNNGYDPNLNDQQPSHGLAVASLVFGIIAVVLGFVEGVGFVPGIIGIILAAVAKKNGNTESYATAGLALSIIAVSFGLLILIACIGCGGCLVCAGLAGSAASSL